jgi:hypothetical protein
MLLHPGIFVEFSLFPSSHTLLHLIVSGISYGSLTVTIKLKVKVFGWQPYNFTFYKKEITLTKIA